VAPFPLITFEDAVKRGKSLVKVTESRVMPPWHAAHGYGEFADERRLTDAQIAVIRDWVEHGMKRGDAAKMPPLPTFTDGWQLGTPDLILEMPEAFEVPASGPDIYRNFVLPTGATEDRWIKAIEYRPGTRTLVGVEAVIDKDRASAVLARDLGADALVIATDTDAVYVDWGTPDQRAIALAHPDDLGRIDFPAGSMGPKVSAAIEFARSSGRDALIGSLADLPAVLAGQSGTRVSLTATGVTYHAS